MIRSALMMSAWQCGPTYRVTISYEQEHASVVRKEMRKGETVTIPETEEINGHEYENNVIELKGFTLKEKTYDEYIYILSNPSNNNFIKIRRNTLTG